MTFVVQTSSNRPSLLRSGKYLVGPTCKPCSLSYQRKLQNDESLSLRLPCATRDMTNLTILRPVCTKNSSEITTSDNARFPQILGDTPQVNTHSKGLDGLKLSESVSSKSQPVCACDLPSRDTNNLLSTVAMRIQT